MTPKEQVAQEETPKESQQLLLKAIKKAESEIVLPRERSSKFLASALISLRLGKLWGDVNTEGNTLEKFSFLEDYATDGVINLLSSTAGQNVLLFSELRDRLNKTA